MTEEKIKEINNGWIEYNKALTNMKRLMQGTSNILGDYSEILVGELYQAEKLPPSWKSADLKCRDGRLIQVKSRQVDRWRTTTSLGIIRSWKFDFLVVVLFYEDGSLFKVIEMSSADAKTFAVPNAHQNGSVITTTKRFLESELGVDKTEEMKKLVNKL